MVLSKQKKGSCGGWLAPLVTERYSRTLAHNAHAGYMGGSFHSCVHVHTCIKYYIKDTIYNSGSTTMSLSFNCTTDTNSYIHTYNVVVAGTSSNPDTNRQINGKIRSDNRRQSTNGSFVAYQNHGTLSNSLTMWEHHYTDTNDNIYSTRLDMLILTDNHLVEDVKDSCKQLLRHKDHAEHTP